MYSHLTHIFLIAFHALTHRVHFVATSNCVQFPSKPSSTLYQLLIVCDCVCISCYYENYVLVIENLSRSKDDQQMNLPKRQPNQSEIVCLFASTNGTLKYGSISIFSHSLHDNAKPRIAIRWCSQIMQKSSRNEWKMQHTGLRQGV